MSEPLENLYFNWLCTKISQNGRMTPSNSYLTLLKILHNTEFVWLLDGDDNRAEDGKELRREFLIIADIPDDQNWRALPCSLFEMFIAFAKRAEFQTGDSLESWFWEFMENLNLKQFHDASDASTDDIIEILDRFVWRTYREDGVGGIFPLSTSHYDQRTIEIWYQLTEYLEDQDRLP